MADDGIDELAGQCGGRLVALGLGKVTLQHRRGRALSEVRLEHRGERQAAPGTSTAEVVSLRRHRRSP